MVLCIAYGKPDTVTAFAMTEGLTAIVFARGCEARSKDGEGRNDDEKQCTKLPRAKYKMNILVLGGTQFMGVHLVNRLIAYGHDVTILTRGRIKHGFDGDVKHMIADRSDRESLVAVLSGKRFDVVCDNICFCSSDVRNIMSSVNMKRYVMISTASVYENLHVDTHEDEFDPLAHKLTWMRHDGISPEGYGEAKRQAEAALFRMYPDIPSVAVRFPLVAGKDDYTKRLYFYVEHVIRKKPININNLNEKICFVNSSEAGQFLSFLAESNFCGVLNGACAGSVSPAEIITFVEEKTGCKAVLSASGDEAPYNSFKSFSLNSARAHGLGFEFSGVNDWMYTLLEYYIKNI
jgi:nucleoside-diphosphate-sugar epimerase